MISRFSRITLILLSSLIVISGCKQSSDVVSNGWLQKRKYRTGYHLDLGKQNQKEVARVYDYQRHESTKLKRTSVLNRLPALGTIQTATSNNQSRILKTRTSRQGIAPITSSAGDFKDSSEEEPQEDDPEERGKKSDKRAKISFIIATLAFAVSIFSYIYTSGFILFVNPALLLLSPLALGIGLTAATIGLIYLIDYLKSRDGQTVFTEKFYEVMGKIALGLGVTSLILSILTGMGLFVLLLAGIAAAGSLGGIVAIFLGLYLLGIFVTIFMLITWPTITAVWFSFKHSKKGKTGFLLWLLPFIGVLALTALVLFL